MTDLDYGIKDPQIYAFDEAQQIILKNITGIIKTGEIVNPFYVPFYNEEQIDTNTSEISSCRRVLVICLKNGVVPSDIILSQCSENPQTGANFDTVVSKFAKNIITTDDFNNFKEYYVLVSCDKKLIKNKNHFNSAIKISKELLEGFILHGDPLENEEFVVCMPEIYEKDLNEYKSLYDDKVTIDTLQDLMMLYDYFRCSSYYPTKMNLAAKIIRLKDSEYFTNPYNCEISNTNNFLERRFQYKELPDNKIKASTSITITENETLSQLLNRLNKLKKEGIDYLKFINKPSDMSHEFKSQNTVQKYYISKNNVEFSKDDMTKWFSNISDDKIKFNLFSALCLSKDYCHLLVNNKNILNIMKPLFQKSMPYMRYVLGYSWLYLCLEESIKKTRVSVNDRFIFSIDTAAALPVFPYSTHDVHMNPYCTLLLPTNIIDYDNNFSSLPMITNFQDYGIDTLAGFKYKFNLFTGNIFNGLNWKNKFAVSGSTILACSQKKNPLINLVSSPDMSETDRLERYFNEYYGQSDIDLMCNRESIFEFIDCVQELVSTIKTNLIAQENSKSATQEVSHLEKIVQSVDESLKIEPVKSLLIIVTQQYIDKFMKNFIDDNELSEQSKQNYVTDNIDNNAIKEHFFTLYLQYKIKTNAKYRKKNKCKNNKLYEDHYKMIAVEEISINIVKDDIVGTDTGMSDHEVSFMFQDLADEDDGEIDTYGKEYLRITENIKFKITSKYMKRGVEVFRIKFDDFFSCVSRFHLNCVRGFYDGDDVKLLPSCITALMTGINMDYKYFSGQRDPIVILNKYRSRGQAPILNDAEKMHVAEYNGTIDNMNGMYHINLNNKNDVLNHFGPKTLTSTIYKPLHYSLGYLEDAYVQTQESYVRTEDDLYNVYKDKYGYDPRKSGINFLAYKTINKNGNVEPVKLWLLEAAYSDLFST